MPVNVDTFTSRRNRLGESPVWDWRSGELWWVDGIEGMIFSADAGGCERRAIPLGEPVGSIGLHVRGLIAAAGRHVLEIDLAGDILGRREADFGASGLRFNDGKADRQGRFVAGTIQHDPALEVSGSLWIADRSTGLRRLEDGLRVTNATCFSPEGDWLYVADSLDGILRRYPYDPGQGTIGARENLVDCREYGSRPDGATVDRSGNLWVAMVEAQCVACFSPEGRFLRRIDLPSPYPSCPAFGGPGFARLFVTTISDSGHRLKSDAPGAGRLLVIDGLDAEGIPEALCSR